MKRCGFSLVEVMIAIVLVGLAIASLVVANSSFTKANGAGADLSTAEFLIEQFRELTAMMSVVDPQTETATFGPEEAGLSGYDDLDDFDGLTLSPPISAEKTVLTDFGAFSQQITVTNVSSSDFEQVISDHGSPFVRVTVRIFLNSKEITSANWLRARY